MAVARKHDNADAASRGVPHCVEHGAALGEEAAPRVLAVDGPVLGEGHGGGDNLPLHAAGLGAAQVGEQVSQLVGAQHGLLRVGVGDGVGRAVGARVEEEEGGRALGELVPGDAAGGGAEAGGLDGGRVDGGVVVVPGLDGGFVDAGLVGVPVVFDLMVVEYVDPREVLADVGPLRGCIDGAVLLAVVGGFGAPVLGHVGVDEVTQEEHELGAEGWDELG